MTNPKRIAILHYAAPPVIGGVESVLEAHASLFIRHGYDVTVIAGRGEAAALPQHVKFLPLPMIDSQHPEITAMNQQLEQGIVPANFEKIKEELVQTLKPILTDFNAVIVHNIFTKHFNLPLTAALFTLLDEDVVGNWIAWSHDFTWTSPNSSSKVFPKYPWDLLRKPHPKLQQVVVSKNRQKDLAELYQVDPKKIHVVYNGVDAETLLGLSSTAMRIVSLCGLTKSDLTLLMPVRVTQAKNIEFALHMLAEIKQAGLNPKLILTGPPDPHDPQNMAYFEALKTLRDELGLQENMRFVYELTGNKGEPLTLSMDVVGELFRAADLLLMPSHREGFGMPILEAGLCGLAVFSAPIPATVEIGQTDVHWIDIHEKPAVAAQQILDWCENNQIYHMRRRVRQHYTWEALFQHKIKPLIESGEPS
jgi:glycosyltransferase involved in cell wall biosynthesis